MEEAKKGKSAGPDDLLAELFLNLGKKAKLTLLHFYNVIWNASVSSDWRKFVIIPILKPLKPTDHPSSYRPISLTNGYCKLMERIVTNQLNYFFEAYKKISDLGTKEIQLNKQDHFSYLGATFDNRLSWRGHAEGNTKKGEKKLGLLKRLAGVTWGSSDVLSTFCKSYARPVFDYGGELLATASKICGDIIDRIQNKAFRLIPSAFSSTPIAALEI
ncbi:uncharacterized protein TNIN_241211 [Trichonephila inaurata madagascariensis]|uniref:Reverse transcriptase n=1 Tax=Trichonephila inaurata madagascariensis TaxID=2747483 RepID=A0A8X6MDC6_9ARAC|nr:uncharacterized protein TNIN_241211 [Trichonephila inaurata madagascariensis]